MLNVFSGGGRGGAREVSQKKPQNSLNIIEFKCS